ncbi:predicted protein [Aspergillus terreus NIH2624]|uniref:Azaphilone biosynthesis cluster protein M n=1 Tax=Aspergillus terreus (strain NIH 2624 / FGSC A1156) TaxID=341663 RepID=TAZM_ASPTN|nr:uncharacterized protein ATEG_03434 [Aspergillus terreus NIH2624]Q0CSA0.1 RecName: Full=Azaphilone biosynthesis cluster protein M [Aspergillus terreus NIH2624]EAU36708.1 predicted protein [Aspergillus terreus NIH2624]
MGSIINIPGLPDGEFSNYEQVYLKMSRAFSHLQKEHWGIHCVCSVSRDSPNGSTFSETLRQAWMRLVVEYPGLSMVPVGLQKKYPRLDEKVVLLIQHWRVDALGTCMLLDRLFEILGQSTVPSTQPDQVQPNQPTPSFESAAGASKTEDADLQAYARDYIDSFHQRAVNADGLPYRGDATTPPSTTAHWDLDFSVDSTNAIKDACRHHKISVTAAIHTALARTVFSYLTETECQAGYTTVMAVNMRPYLPPPYNSKKHACQTFVASITPTVPYHSGFVESARSLTHEYRSWWSADFMRSLWWIYEYHLAKLSAPRPANAAPMKPPSGVTLSSLGVVDRNLRGGYGPNLRVDKFRFGVSMMTRQTILYAWTFKDRLTLSLNYNDAYYSDLMAREVMSRVASHLEKGLEVELNTV